jgi:hypothetical protein
MPLTVLCCSGSHASEGGVAPLSAIEEKEVDARSWSSEKAGVRRAGVRRAGRRGCGGQAGGQPAAKRAASRQACGQERS